MSNQKSHYLLKELNLEPVVIKAMDKEEGYGWSLEYALAVSEEYRKFLVLCLKNLDEAVVPSSKVDDFWHLHILDTQKYAEDCAIGLGYFLHHFPYFGMRGEEDERNLQSAWERTKKLYLSEFGGLPAGLWVNSKRCPNCGRRIHGDPSFVDKRPSFADLQLTA